MLPSHAPRTVLFRSAAQPLDGEVVRAVGADAVILDLEASVRPDRKEQARHTLVEWLSDDKRLAPTVAVRINDEQTPEAERDLAMLARTPGFDAIVLPRVMSAESLRAAAGWAASLGRDRTPRLWAMVETPTAVNELPGWVDAGLELHCVVMGYKDLALALGVAFDPRQPVLRDAARRVRAVAAERGIAVIDGPAYGPPDLVRTCVDLARQDGFDGVALLYPELVAYARRVFGGADAPSERRA
jgi:citrate lyase subunit beta / citryl-CoA lyase